MNCYDVVIKETLEMTVSVVAEDMASARDAVKQKYKDSEYILDASHFKDVAFSTLYPYNNAS